MRLAVWCLVGAVAAGLPPRVAAQSLTYSRGQNVSPAYEGWEEDGDGKRYFVFGYMNRNWEEELDVPVGPDNGFDKGPADQGQPTHFLPRRNRFVFRVQVPAGFTETDELVWTLTTQGRQEKAYASLRLDYKIDDVVRASETGALGAGSSSPEVRANKAPSLEVQGPKRVEVRVGETVTLSARVADDGIPRPRAVGSGSAVANQGSSREINAAQPTAAQVDALRARRMVTPPSRVTVGKTVGLHVSWFVYRGAGAVTFWPDQVAAWEDTRTGGNSPWAPLWTPPVIEDGRATVQATFSTPGEYVIRARADDGALTTDGAVTVIVRK
jgi:plastocyanin